MCQNSLFAMKTIVLILLVFGLAIASFGQNKLKTHDDLVKQIFALKGIGCHVTSSISKEAERLNLVECRIGTDSTFITLVSFTFKGENQTESIDNFILSFLFTTTNREWCFPLNIVNGSAGASMKDLENLNNSETFMKERRFQQNNDLTILADGKVLVFKKPQKYRKGIFVQTIGTNVGQISLTEQIYFAADREMLSKLAGTKTIEIELGSFESIMPERVQKMFQSILDLASVQ